MTPADPHDRSARLRALAQETFDVLVIGGGIYGATLACESARAGFRTAMVEKEDYGGAASANSLKILHGGLRYLQQLDIRRMRESVRARRDGLSSLPYLTRAATFLAPVGRRVQRSAFAYGVASVLNNIVSFDRNRGVPPDHCLAPARVISRERIRQWLPDGALDAPGALCWSDGFVENSERYTLAYIMSARDAGAVTLNYVEAVHLLETAGRVIGARVRDKESNAMFDVRARWIVDATSGWSGGLWPSGVGPPPVFPRVRAYNLVAKRRWFGEFGVGLEAADRENRSLRRNFFFMPWRGGTIIGTVYKPFANSPDEAGLSPDEIADFVGDVNTLYPAAALTVEDITFAHVGVLPARVDRRGRALPEPSGATTLLDLRQEGREGFLSLRGVKYTTAAWWARKTIRQIAGRVGARPSGPADSLYGAALESADAIRRDAANAGWVMTPAMAAWLARTYGARARDVTALGAADARLRAGISGSDMPLACVAHAVWREDARTLADVVFRRSDIGSFAFPGDAALEEIAGVMAALRAWDAARQRAEIAGVRAVYRRLGLKPAES